MNYSYMALIFCLSSGIYKGLEGIYFFSLCDFLVKIHLPH